jgi:hypothetical protein
MAECNSKTPCKYDHPARGTRHPSSYGYRSGFSKLDREARVAEANARKAEWDTLTLQQQLEDLGKRRGQSARQKARILKRIEAERAAPVKTEKKARS